MIQRIGYRYFMNALRRYNKFILTLTTLLFLLAPFAVFAGPAVCAPEENKTTNDLIRNTFSCKQGPGITFRATECVKEILTKVTNGGFDSILDSTKKVVTAVLTMFISLTGIKMVLGGVRNMKGEALTTIVKLAFVASFALGYGVGFVGPHPKPGLQIAYDLVQGINSGLVDLVGSTLTSNGACSVAENGGPETNLWKRIDCSIFAFIGKVSPGYEDQIDAQGNIMKVAKVARGPRDLNCNGTIEANEKNVPIDDITLFDIGLSQLFTPHGIFVLALLGVAAVMMLLAFGRALYVYVVSFVAITFLFLLGPIFIPMILFARTRQMFITWFTMIIGYMIQPAMLMAFLVFLLASMNVVLYGTKNADGSVASPGFTQSLDKMNAAMRANECTRVVVLRQQNAIAGEKENQTISDFQSFFKKVGEERNNITAPVTPISYPDLAVFMVHLIGCIVLLYIMMALMSNVAEFVASLTAGVGSNLSRIGNGLQQVTGAAKDAFNSASQ